MIGEFAFTPSVFDEQAHPDPETWREQLRELGHGMFPRTASCPLMVANLYAGSWRHEALKAAKAIKDGKSRILSEGLLGKISQILVNRPPAMTEWPENDLAWGREAVASSEIEPIDRIISCRTIQDSLVEPGRPVRCIDEVQADGFWSDISSQWSQPLNIASQVQAIRKLSLHADFLCLITPHIRGTSDDETDFAVELIRSTLRRPIGFPPVDIEVHGEGPDNPSRSEFGNQLQNQIHNASKSLIAALQTGQIVKLVLWPKLLDRYLIAGVYTESSNGTRLRSPRWGIAMSHIARRSDAGKPNASTPWSLLTEIQLGDEFAKYCNGSPPANYPVITITGS